MPISLSFNTHSRASHPRTTLAFLHPHLILFLTKVLILSYDCIALHVGCQRVLASVLFALLPAALAVALHWNIKLHQDSSHCAVEQWSRPGQEQMGNQGDAHSDKLGKCIPDVGIGVYKAFSFALFLIFMRSESTAGL